MSDQLKVGDKVRNIYHPLLTGTIVRIISQSVNPYNVQLLLETNRQGKAVSHDKRLDEDWGVFNEEHLEGIR